jgi:uncharacterized protein (TIGR02391 family)
VDPTQNGHLWLQGVGNIHLTLDGRDRARGRLVLAEPPDPNEDDGRQIAAITLKDVARDIALTYSWDQIPIFFHDSGIPDASSPPSVASDGQKYVVSVLAALLEGGSEARRIARSFLGRWLSDRLVTGPSTPESADAIERQLARQGWVVSGDRLIVGVPEPELLAQAPRNTGGRRFEALHPLVREAAERFLGSQQLEVAVFEAFKAVARRVKQMSGLPSDGADLMAKAFGGDAPVLRVGDMSTDIGRDRQDGFRFLFMGAARAIRNPGAHEAFSHLNDDAAFERLSLASLLMRCLDDISLAKEVDGS